MSSEMTTQQQSNRFELTLIGGDLAALSGGERLEYYRQVCESLGLNPLTQPFAYITLNNRLTLYAKKDCTEQLRKINGVSITELKDELREGVYVVTAKATDQNGRSDVAKGAVNVGGLKGDALANAIMKAETKAKRRVTLSICGLGLLDETELETVPPAGPGGNSPRQLPAPAAQAPAPAAPLIDGLSEDQLRWLGEQCKGKGDWARGLLEQCFGVTGARQVPRRCWPILELCVRHQVDPVALLDQFEGKPKFVAMTPDQLANCRQQLEEYVGKRRAS